MTPNTSVCPSCGKSSPDSELITSWTWVSSRQHEGKWFCSRKCAIAGLQEMEGDFKRWTPTPEERERMGE